MRPRIFIQLFFSISFLFFCLSANAITFTFTGNTNQLWDESSNWIPFYPGTTVAIVNEVAINNNCNTNNLDIVIEGNITIAGNFTNSGTLSLGTSANMVCAGRFFNTGTFNCSAYGDYFDPGAIIDGKFANDGTVNILDEGALHISSGFISYNSPGATINNSSIFLHASGLLKTKD